jgi:hypothetical protein
MWDWDFVEPISIEQCYNSQWHDDYTNKWWIEDHQKKYKDGICPTCTADKQKAHDGWMIIHRPTFQKLVLKGLNKNYFFYTELNEIICSYL